MRSFRIASLGLVVIALAAGCSLVNSLDEIKPADDGRFSGDTRPTPINTFDDAGFGPTNTGTADAAEAGGGETFSPLVVGGEVADPDGGTLNPVLTVLDSKTGAERSKREAMWVAGVAHDDKRDLWYIFESKNYFLASSTETVKVHIRRLDAKTGAWTELSVFEGSPLAYYDAIAVTSERLSYVAHPAISTPDYRLVTINTTDPASPTLNSEVAIGADLPRGVTATPSTTGLGGNISLITVGKAADGECTVIDGGTSCQVKLRRYVTNGGTPSFQTPAALFGGMANTGQPGYASVACGANKSPDDVVVMPGVGFDNNNANQNGVQTITTLDYLSSGVTGSRTFTMSTAIAAPTLLRKVAIDNARRIAFVVEANNDTALYAVPLPKATDPQDAFAKINLRHSGQSVYYDPASETAFAPFNQGEGKTFSAIKVTGGTGGTPISLSERTGGDWNPPADLHPNFLGISQAGQTCQ